MHLSASRLDSLQERIDRLRVCNQQLREDLAAEVARFPKRHRGEILGFASDRSHSDRKLNDLTPRELEVLQMIARGSSTKDLAQRLGIAFKTAACHRHRLMQKLEVHTTSSLVRIAISAGLVEV